uniref:Uncharacterized protein n=1 Tax=Trichogramma kaykai TaxID=54128 RepID=A0ABD2XCW4_9HYME
METTIHSRAAATLDIICPTRDIICFVATRIRYIIIHWRQPVYKPSNEDERVKTPTYACVFAAPVPTSVPNMKTDINSVESYYVPYTSAKPVQNECRRTRESNRFQLLHRPALTIFIIGRRRIYKLSRALDSPIHIQDSFGRFRSVLEKICKYKHKQQRQQQHVASPPRRRHAAAAAAALIVVLNIFNTCLAWTSFMRTSTCAINETKTK